MTVSYSGKIRVRLDARDAARFGYLIPEDDRPVCHPDEIVIWVLDSGVGQMDVAYRRPGRKTRRWLRYSLDPEALRPLVTDPILRDAMLKLMERGG